MDFEQQPPSHRQRFQSMMGFITFLAQSFAVSVEPFLHSRFGSRYFGAPGAAVLVVIPVYTLFWQGYDVTPLFWLMGLFLLACVCERSAAAKREKRGEVEHSRYSGRPWLGKVLPRLREETIKALVEPVLVVIAAAIVHGFNEPLGCYLLFAALGMFISTQMSLNYQSARQTDINDSYVEQKNLAEWFRESRNRR